MDWQKEIIARFFSVATEKEIDIIYHFLSGYIGYERLEEREHEQRAANF